MRSAAQDPESLESCTFLEIAHAPKFVILSYRIKELGLAEVVLRAAKRLS